MNVLIDSIIYQIQKRGGLSRIFSEILPRMCDIDPSLHAEMFVTGHLNQVLPSHPQIHHRTLYRPERWLPKRPSRVYRRLLPLAKQLKSPIHQTQLLPFRDYLWHSTYYTLPKMKWRGPLVFFVADMVHELFPQYYRPEEDDRQIKQAAICAADRLICISETTRRDLLSFYSIPSDKINVVHLACSDTFRVRPPEALLQSPIQEPFLLYVGERGRYKEFRTLLDAYSQWAHRENIALVVVGRKWTQAERQVLVDNHIENRVYLLENVEDETLCLLYNLATVFLYPSLYEGFGIPLLEAMACGCPIIASRINSTIEVAADCPIYFSPRDSESLINALDHVLSEGRSSARTIAGLTRVQQFSWAETAKQILQIYQQLMVK